MLTLTNDLFTSVLYFNDLQDHFVLFNINRDCRISVVSSLILRRSHYIGKEDSVSTLNEQEQKECLEKLCAFKQFFFVAKWFFTLLPPKQLVDVNLDPLIATVRKCLVRSLSQKTTRAASTKQFMKFSNCLENHDFIGALQTIGQIGDSGIKLKSLARFANEFQWPIPSNDHSDSLI